MPLTLPFSSSLAEAVGSTASRIRLAAGMGDVCTALAANSVQMTLFSAAYSENVLATGCETVGGVQYLTVQRGFGGATARAWALDTCVCATQLLPLCATEAAASEGCDCPDPLAGVVAEGCIEIDRSNPLAPVIRLAATGVTPVSNGCIRINACGLVEWVSPNFPTDCLPVFNPCGACTPGGSGASGEAADVAFVPPPGVQYALGPNVYSALIQLDAALQACCDGASVFVEQVLAGTGIAVTGTSAAPVVSLAAGPMAPGTYGEFDVDDYGRIVGYTPAPPATSTAVAATAPITASYNLPTNTYTIGVAPATSASYGSVILAEAAEVTAGTADPDDVITASVLDAALNALAHPSLDVTDGLRISPAGGPFTANRTLALGFGTLATEVSIDVAGDVLAFWDATAGSHKGISRDNLSRDLGGAYSAGEFVGATAVSVALRNVGSVTRNAVGDYSVTLSSPGALPSDYVVHAVALNMTAGWSYTYTRLTATQFDLKFFDATGAPFDPPRVGFTTFSLV